MVLHNAHVVDYLQSATHWNNAALEAEHWCSMPVVAPTDAAMLLCQHNPNETTFDDAARCTNEETGPRELIQLQQQFEALNTVAPSDRTLHNWRNIAISKGLRYHSWIDGYVEATAPPVVDTGPTAPVVPASDNPAPPAHVVSLIPKSKRRHLLSPLIESAQRQALNPSDASEIWAKLCDMAEAQNKPLKGRTEEGIQWTNGNDEVKYLFFKLLRDRLVRQKKNAVQRDKPL